MRAFACVLVLLAFWLYGVFLKFPLFKWATKLTNTFSRNKIQRETKMLLMTNIPSNFHAYIRHSVLNFEVLAKLYTCFQGDLYLVEHDLYLTLSLSFTHTLFQIQTLDVEKLPRHSCTRALILSPISVSRFFMCASVFLLHESVVHTKKKEEEEGTPKHSRLCRTCSKRERNSKRACESEQNRERRTTPCVEFILREVIFLRSYILYTCISRSLCNRNTLYAMLNDKNVCTTRIQNGYRLFCSSHRYFCFVHSRALQLLMG